MFRMLRTNRDIRTLFIAQVVSYMGDWFCYVALIGLVNDLTDSSLLVALVFVSQALPGFLVAPIAGAAADRFDRRRIIVTVSCVQAVAAIVLLGVGPGRVWLAFLAQATIAAFGTFVVPASQAAVPNLARDDGGEKATRCSARRGGRCWPSARRSAVRSRRCSGGTPAFIADATSFVLAAVLVFTIRRPMPLARDAAEAGGPCGPSRT